MNDSCVCQTFSVTKRCVKSAEVIKSKREKISNHKKQYVLILTTNIINAFEKTSKNTTCTTHLFC